LIYKKAGAGVYAPIRRFSKEGVIQEKREGKREKGKRGKITLKY
jgi:hypothetical protein